MDEENKQNQQEQKDLPDRLMEQGAQFAGQAGKQTLKRAGEVGKKGLQILKEAAKKIAVQIAAFIAAHIVPIIIIIVIILTASILIPAIDNYLDEEVASEVDEVVYELVKDYCTIDENGIRFDKEGFLESVVAELSLIGIDLNDLGLGDDGNYRVAAQNTIDDGTYVLLNTIDPNSQAAKYLYKFVTAALAGEIPYIEESDEEVQGIIKIKRKKQEGEEATELTYMGYKKFQEMLQTTDRKEKEELQNYFSLDEDWNLCIAKPFKRIVNTYSHGSLTSSQEEYTISEVKIPYRNMVAQYTVPFLFLIDLQSITNNAAYVEAVSELMTKQSEIEFTIFDQITTTTDSYNYKAQRHVWQLEEIGLDGEMGVIGGPHQKVWNENIFSVDETTEIITDTDIIKANVTKAKTWIIEQETNYEMQENREYPYGKDGQTNTLPGETDPGGHASWDEQRSEHLYMEIITREWMKSGDSKTIIKPSEFMGLWSNASGTYVKGAPYLPNGKDLPGKIVEYQMLGSSKLDDPIGKIVTASEELYGLLESSEKTQTHAEIMRECINFYLTGKELTESFATRFKPLFDVEEFIDTNWNNLGSGFWWPINDITQKRISSPFGYRGNIGVAGASRYHKGMDIAVPVGTEVIAVADGVVEVAGTSLSAGNWIRINHGNGIKTVYMHNSKLLVTVGQPVKQGDIIALSGNTGISGGPHLHFGVEVNGEYTDPANYVNPDNPRPSATVPDVPVDVEAWRPYIVQAFSELGYTATEEKIGAILRQIKTESGGNQGIMQGIVDSNTGKSIKCNNGICPWCNTISGKSCYNTNIGHGLLQFIPDTFNANMVYGHTNIFNGYDQICACISMLEKRAGSYTNYIGKGTGWG